MSYIVGIVTWFGRLTRKKKLVFSYLKGIEGNIFFFNYNAKMERKKKLLL
jgi:hypothetical protein